MRGKVIYNCLVNWEELKTYFAVAEQESAQDARYEACTIVEMLSDPINLLYFHFVSPLVTEFERVNGFFPATDADPEEMDKELYSHSRREACVTEFMMHMVIYCLWMKPILEESLNWKQNLILFIRQMLA